MSTIKFMIITIKATAKTTDWIRGKSLEEIDWTISDPIPGSEKTFSTTRLPPILEVILIPMIVITGTRAFLSTCLYKISFKRSPFILAVLT